MLKPSKLHLDKFNLWNNVEIEGKKAGKKERKKKKCEKEERNVEKKEKEREKREGKKEKKRKEREGKKEKEREGKKESIFEGDLQIMFRKYLWQRWRREEKCLKRFLFLVTRSTEVLKIWGSLDFPFIVITPSSTQTWSGSIY